MLLLQLHKRIPGNAGYVPSVIAFLLFFGLTACSKPPQTVRGVAPAPETNATAHDLVKATAARPVTIRGEMVEKCPTAGCWFILRDKTGTVRVDTKAAGFVVSDVPLHTTILVSGKSVPGAEPGIAATGIRF